MQEPGTDAEIKEFATGKYGAQFDLFSKINVNGNDAHPLWKYLKSKQAGFLFEWVLAYYHDVLTSDVKSARCFDKLSIDFLWTYYW